MAYVYILQSEEGKYYTGSTVDLNVRLKRHQAGTATRTTTRGTWFLVYVKEFDTLTEARVEEKRIKSFKGGNAFKRLVGKM